MAAGCQPARNGTFWQIREVLQRTRVNIGASRVLIQSSRDRCETARRLVQESAQLQEFLRENVLNAWGRHEHREDAIRRLCSRPQELRQRLELRMLAKQFRVFSYVAVAAN